jgi:hypothetical protein
MSPKQLVRLAAILLVVIALWGAVALASRRSDEGSAGERLLPKIDSSAVDSIALIGPQDTALLKRPSKSESGWRVNGHRADSQAVGQILKALAEPDAAAELVARNPNSHERLRVTEDSGRRIRVLSRGRVLLDLLAGKQATDGQGIYLRRSNQPEVYVVGGELASALARTGEEWRDHTIANVNTDSVARIEISRGKRSYALKREGSRWLLGSGAPADSASVANLLASYRAVEAAGFATKTQRDPLRFDRRRRSARLLDRAGKPLLALSFDSVASGIWVQVEGEGQPATGEPYRIESWTADQLTPADSTLRKR